MSVGEISTMRVRLNTAIVGHLPNGGEFAFQIGDEVECGQGKALSKADAERYLERGFASLPDKAKNK